MAACFQLRPGSDDRLADVVEVLRAIGLYYLGHSSVDLATIRERVAADPAFDLTRDQRIAEVDGEVVGVATVNPEALNVDVHPGHEFPGLREALLDWGEARLGELGRPLCVQTPSTIAPTVALLQASGYRVERSDIEMVRRFTDTGPPALPRLPDGYRLRPIDPSADLIALHALDDRAFATRPDYHPEGLEEFAARHLSHRHFAGEWSHLVVAADGTACGSVLGARRPGRAGGYIAVLAVEPEHQHRGLGRALLLSAFAAIAALTLESASLHVASDNPRALDLYTGVGMAAGERIDAYRRERP